jgi:signal transduction histidine kinase/CheY-like chemotaxis protein
MRAFAFMRRCWITGYLVTAIASGQNFITLEQAAARSGIDFTAVFEGRPVAVQGQVTSRPVWALGTYYLPLRDETDHGLLLRGEREDFSDLAPGDWIEALGTIQSRAALPLLAADSIRKMRHGAPAEPTDLSLSDIAGFRYLGLVVRTTATVASVGENLGGRSLVVSDHGTTLAIFLPRPSGPNPLDLRRIRAGDRVRITGLATQYSLEAPHNGGFQLLLASPGDVEVIPPPASMMPPLLLLTGFGLAGLAVLIWSLRARRVGAARQSMRAFHTLSEEIISAGSPREIAEKLATVLPSVTQATAVRLYLYNRRSKFLERVSTSAEPEPMAVPIDSPPEGLASGAAACFRNRTLLNVPDVRRSPFLKIASRANLPRSAMFVPMLSKGDVAGVLELGNARHMGYFTVEEQAAAQHLANQVAAALKLQEQQTIREQLFRTEKLAATGQLISGIANDLRAPLDSIVKLAASLAESAGRAVSERDLRFLAGESRRASEIVSRLVSFARPEDSGARPVDVNALITGLMQFREPEWKQLGLRVQNRVSTQSAFALGAQGQIEQVLLSLLVHAEQCAANAAAKTITVASSVLARRVLVEIAYSVKDSPRDPFAEAGALENGGLGLAVCKGIIQTHGGEIQFTTQSATARFEVDLPLSSAMAKETEPPRGQVRSALTIMVMEPDLAMQRQLVSLLGRRGHRVVPAPLEQVANLAQRLRFDAVFWAVRSSAGRFAEVQERIHSLAGALVLLTDGYDEELARSLEQAGSFLLGRPFQDEDLDRILARIASRSAAMAALR